MSNAFGFKTSRWVGLAFLNLFIVAILGVLMRYKIAFSLPWLDQKHIQHAHSHFAFSGWVSLMLMAAMVNYLEQSLNLKRLQRYRQILFVHCIAAYGMLVGFAWQGYGWFSITCSTISIVNSVAFCFLYFNDLRKSGDSISHQWFKAAMLFQVVSYLGTAVLTYMMMSKSSVQTPYLASVYWYLHFQYNGWFFFACMGLLQARWQHYGGLRWPPVVFQLFFWSCIPAYGLSVLWINLSNLLYLPVILAAFAQVVAYYWLLRVLKLSCTGTIRGNISPITWRLLIFAGGALAVKFLLQLASVVPWVSQWAFGFRTVVIAYLHLVLLAVVTVFLLSYVQWKGWLSTTGASAWAAAMFALGIFLNELTLAVQGIASFSYTLIPYADKLLLVIAVFMAYSVFLLLKNLLRQHFDGYD